MKAAGAGGSKLHAATAQGVGPLDKAPCCGHSPAGGLEGAWPAKEGMHEQVCPQQSGGEQSGGECSHVHNGSDEEPLAALARKMLVYLQDRAGTEHMPRTGCSGGCYQAGLLLAEGRRHWD